MEDVLSLSDAESIRLTMNRNRDAYIGNWRMQSKYISPGRFIGSEPNQRNKGQEKALEIIRNEAGRALRTFVAGMMNGATSRARPWFDMTLMNQSKMNTEAKRYFSNCTTALNQHFQVSNLYRVLPISYKDIGIFSNSAFAMLPHDRYGAYFIPFAVGTYSIGTDSEGRVNQFSRDFLLTVRQIVEMYGQLKPTGHIDWSNMEPWIKSAWENSNYTQEATLANIITPNKNPKPESLQSVNAMKYQSYTYVRGIGSGSVNMFGAGSSANFVGTRTNESPFLSMKGYEYFPIIANRWEVAPEADWGIDGPGQMAIGDIKTLQETEKYRLEGVAKLVRPPMVAPASLKRHQSSILAGGITYVDEASEGTKYRAAFEINPNLSELINSQGDYIRAIKSAFFEDLFMMISSEQKLSHVSAREMAERAAEKLVGIGPALGQLDEDQNARIIQNFYYLLSKMKGRLPDAPKSIQGEEVRVEYISILAQAQKASMVTSAEKMVSFVAGLSQSTQDPTVLKIIKTDKMARQYGEFIGIDPENIRDEEEFATIVEGMNQKAQEQERMASMNMASQTSKNLSDAQLSDDNMLGVMANMTKKL